MVYKMMMAVFAITAIFFLSSSEASVPLSVEQQFQLFQKKYHKVYTSNSRGCCSQF